MSSDALFENSTMDSPNVAFVLELLYHLRFEVVFSLAFIVAVTVSGKVVRMLEERKSGPKKGSDVTPGRAQLLAQSIIDLCGTQYAKGADLFHNNQATLEELSHQEYRALLTQLIITSVRVGYCSRVKGYMQYLKDKSMQCDDSVLLSMLKVLSSRKKFQDTIELHYQWVEMFGRPTLAAVRSCMLHCFVETEKFGEADKIFQEMLDSEQVTTRDYATIIRSNVLNKNWEKAVEQIREMKGSGMDPDCVAYNMVLSACANAHQVAEVDKLFGEMTDRDTITINTRLKAYAQRGDVMKCEKFMEEMKASGVTATAVTYGTMLEGYMKAGYFEAAEKTLQTMKDEGVEKNAIIYTILISGMSKAGKVDSALALFKEMKTQTGVVPDVICYSVLIKTLCDVSRVSEAIELFEDLLGSGHQPDEILFNNLLSGCAKLPAVELAQKLLNDMVKHDIRTTNATFSIMLKVYAAAKQFRSAESLLASMESTYNLRPESRLFVQHIMASIRLRRGPSVVATVKMLLEYYPQANLDQVLQCCGTFNLLDTACTLVSENPDSFSRKEIGVLVSTLDRKGKSALSDRLRSSGVLDTR